MVSSCVRVCEVMRPGEPERPVGKIKEDASSRPASITGPDNSCRTSHRLRRRGLSGVPREPLREDGRVRDLWLPAEVFILNYRTEAFSSADGTRSWLVAFAATSP